MLLPPLLVVCGVLAVGRKDSDGWLLLLLCSVSLLLVSMIGTAVVATGLRVMLPPLLVACGALAVGREEGGWWLLLLLWPLPPLVAP